MDDGTFRFTSPDGTGVYVRHWSPEGGPKAVLLIAHGMLEHSQRYEHVAGRLVDHGYAVYAPDHRGHGHTVTGRGTLGHLGDKDGFASVVDDLLALSDHLKNEHAGVPLILFGHSMGSFLARAYASRYGDRLDALVLSGTASKPGVKALLGERVAGVEARLRGPRSRSRLMTALSLGPYNRAFKPNRTDSDWLSRDEAQVDAYVADELSGAVATAGFFRDLLGGLRWVNEDSTAAGMPKNLPVYLVSGEVDPVGGAHAVAEVAAMFARVGMQDVTTRVWPGARHEVLQETNREEVVTELLGWLDGRFPG